MTDWKQIHAASREHIRAEATSTVFVAAVYAVIGLLGVLILVAARLAQTPAAILFIVIGCTGAAYLGLRIARGQSRDPIILAATVLHKQENASYNRIGSIRRCYLQVSVASAFSVNADGARTALPAGRWAAIAATPQLFESVREGDTVTLVCTPSRTAFATVDQLLYMATGRVSR
jgi:hypothetical protein